MTQSNYGLDPSSVLDRRNYGYGNADKAYSIGAEFEVRKGLDFISKNLEAFSIFANLTYIYSEVTLASTSGTGGTTSFKPSVAGPIAISDQCRIAVQ